MFPISAEASENIMDAVRNPIGKEPVKRMRVTEAIKCKFQNMKYRHKLIVLLVTASLAPMILLVWYSHDRMSSLLYEKEMEDMSSIQEQTGEGVDSQIEVFSSLLNYLTYSPDIEDLIKGKNSIRKMHSCVLQRLNPSVQTPDFHRKPTAPAHLLWHFHL